MLVCCDAMQQPLEPLYPSGPDVAEKRSGDPFRCGQLVEKGRAGCGDFDLGLEPSVAPADAPVPFEALRVECRPARFIRCGEEFGQAADSRLCVGQHEARAAVVVGSGEDLPDVPEIAQREIAAAPPRLEGAGVAARAQGPVVEECPKIDILAGCDAVGAACGAHREAVFAPAVALVAEVDAENRTPSGELLQVTAQQARGGCAVAEAFGRHEAVGGAAAQKGPQSGDLTGGARVEDFATLVKDAGYLPEGSGRIALCVFGFGECREFLLACGAAVPDCPPPNVSDSKAAPKTRPPLRSVRRARGRKMPPDELPVRVAISLFRAAHTSDGVCSGAGWRIGQMRSQSPQPVQASAWTVG